MTFTIGETIRVTFQTFGQRWFRFTATTVLAFVAIAAVFGIFGSGQWRLPPTLAVVTGA